jgi:hypothetical protein
MAALGQSADGTNGLLQSLLGLTSASMVVKRSLVEEERQCVEFSYRLETKKNGLLRESKQAVVG